MADTSIQDTNCDVAPLHGFLLSGGCTRCAYSRSNGTNTDGVQWDVAALQAAMSELSDQKHHITQIVYALRRANLPVTPEFLPLITILFQKGCGEDVTVCCLIILGNWSDMLSTDMAADLETALVHRPDCLATRILLLQQYYPRLQDPPSNISRCITQHVSWIIEHAPHMFRCETGILLPRNDPVAYRTLCSALLRKANAIEDPDLCYTGALMIGRQDQDVALRLIERGVQLEPESGRWSSMRGWLLELQLQGMSGIEVQRLEVAHQCLSLYNEAASKLHDADLTSLLCHLARAEFAAGNLVSASSTAQRLAVEPFVDGDYGGSSNAVHLGHTILGLVAIADGKVDLGATHLLQSAAIVGSPQLAAYGPNMALAQIIIELGAHTVVIEFLEKCGAFWQPEDHALDRWIYQIRHSSVPDWNDYIDRVLLPSDYSDMPLWISVLSRFDPK